MYLASKDLSSLFRSSASLVSKGDVLSSESEFMSTQEPDDTIISLNPTFNLLYVCDYFSKIGHYCI